MMKPDGGEGGAGENGEHEKTETADLKELYGKFAASKNAPPDLGGDIDSEKNKESLDQQKKDSEDRQQQREEQVKEGEQKKEEIRKKRPGENVPQIVEARRKAEKERDELQIKVKDFEDTQKPKFEQQIKDLQTRIDSGDLTSKKEKEYADKIIEIEDKLQKRESELLEDNKKLKGRLAYYNLTEDEDFKKSYVEPVVTSYNDAIEIISGDTKKVQAFQQALMLNSQALRASTKEERIEFEKNRNAILSSIADDLDQFSSGNFASAVSRYISGSKSHAQALQEHEKTAEVIKKKANEERDKVISERYSIWDSTYQRLEKQFEPDFEISESEKEVLDELGIDITDEVKNTNHLAKQTIAGNTKLDDAISLVHKGRAYPVLKARITALNKILKSKDELIAKIRTGRTNGDDDSKGDKKVVKKDPEKLDDWMDKFRPQKK